MDDPNRKPEPILDLTRYSWFSDGMVEAPAGEFINRDKAVEIVVDMLKEPRFTEAQFHEIVAERDEAISQRDAGYKRREEALANRAKTITRLERSRQSVRDDAAKLRELLSAITVAAEIEFGDDGRVASCSYPREVRNGIGAATKYLAQGRSHV